LRDLLSRKNTLLTIIFLVLVVGGLYIQNIPKINVSNTLDTVEINGPIYMDFTYVWDKFFMSFTFKNMGLSKVLIENIDVILLLNGTNYNSQIETHNTEILVPRQSCKIDKIIQTTFAPIMRDQVWNITTEITITASSELLIFNTVKTKKLHITIPWEVSFCHVREPSHKSC
jgi:hypothetical protein